MSESASEETYCSILLEFDDANGQLWVKVEPTTRKNEHTKLSTLQIQLKHPEFDGLEIIKENMDELKVAYKSRHAKSLMIAERPPVEMKLSFLEATGQVIATCEKAKKQRELSRTDIQHALEKYDYDKFYVLEENCQLLIQSIESRKKNSYVIAERRNAHIELAIAEDKLSASVTFTTPYGGNMVSLEQLREFLNTHNIHGILDDTSLNSILEAAYKTPQIVAMAKLPIKGSDSEFIYHVADSSIHPKIREDGSVDFYEICELQIVNPGDLLLERTPPGEGTPGLNVLNEVIPAQPGNVIPFAADCTGTNVSPTNPDQLVSAIKGHPLRIAAGVQVDPTIQFNNIDLSTGNINFDGSIHINGDVITGMKIKATGDVFIKGHVNSAEITAGGSLIVQGGIHGKAQSDDNYDEIHCENRITVGHHCTLKFVHNAEINVEGDCVIEQYAYHCNIQVQGSLSLGLPKGKGIIMGGRAFARKEILANELGTHNELNTHIIVGDLPQLNEALSLLSKQLMSRKTELLRLSQILIEVSNTPLESFGKMTLNKNKKIATTFMKMKNAVDELKKQQKELQDQIKSVQGARIIVQKVLYPNVRVTINGVTELYSTEVRKSMTLIKKNQTIVAE